MLHTEFGYTKLRGSVDIQEAFRHAIGDFSVIASRASMAVRGFQILGLPILITSNIQKAWAARPRNSLFAAPGTGIRIY